MTSRSPQPPTDPPDLWDTIMRALKERACTILGEFERAWTELVGKAVILSDGKAGDNADADPPAIVGLVPISEQRGCTYFASNDSLIFPR
jgi:hypothetical protein